jgi:hypothetical protein
MNKGVTAIVVGLVVFVLFGALSGTVLASFASAGQDPNMGSFTNALQINNIMPLFWYIGGMVTGIGLMITGGLGVAGKGPLKSDG